AKASKPWLQIQFNWNSLHSLSVVRINWKLSEEELLTMIIRGGWYMLGLDEEITISEYDSEWPSWYIEEASLLAHSDQKSDFVADLLRRAKNE
ncbi:GrpB family protein, partial [Brevibacillus invocatus]